ncbi:hypothetical protein [Microbacterium sp. Marseille-Q6648]|uniref:hypothetical protein n=1 Tax=Microbacterium sp. Marseille-Q6648 TaxID=2937991 RepID=UPI00203CD5D7|nr:hypothetical protein [Microbacterium sp. Marseille-Q6648]
MSDPRIGGSAIAAPGLERPIDVGNVMAEIEKGQQLAGHFPDAGAFARARRVLVGEISEEDAMREIRQAFHQA